MTRFVLQVKQKPWHLICKRYVDKIYLLHLPYFSLMYPTLVNIKVRMQNVIGKYFTNLVILLNQLLLRFSDTPTQQPPRRPLSRFISFTFILENWGSATVRNTYIYQNTSKRDKVRTLENVKHQINNNHHILTKSIIFRPNANTDVTFMHIRGVVPLVGVDHDYIVVTLERGLQRAVSNLLISPVSRVMFIELQMFSHSGTGINVQVFRPRI